MFIQPGNVPVAETAIAAAAYYVFSKTESISRKSYIIMNPNSNSSKAVNFKNLSLVSDS